jgi:hypothetical protein
LSSGTGLPGVQHIFTGYGGGLLPVSPRPAFTSLICTAAAVSFPPRHFSSPLLAVLERMLRSTAARVTVAGPAHVPSKPRGDSLRVRKELCITQRLGCERQPQMPGTLGRAVPTRAQEPKGKPCSLQNLGTKCGCRPGLMACHRF